MIFNPRCQPHRIMIGAAASGESGVRYAPTVFVGSAVGRRAAFLAPPPSAPHPWLRRFCYPTSRLGGSTGLACQVLRLVCLRLRFSRALWQISARSLWSRVEICHGAPLAVSPLSAARCALVSVAPTVLLPHVSLSPFSTALLPMCAVLAWGVSGTSPRLRVRGLPHTAAPPFSILWWRILHSLLTETYLR